MILRLGTVLTTIILLQACSTNVRTVPLISEAELNQPSSTLTEPPIESHPKKIYDYDTSMWTEMIDLVPEIEVDMAYASEQNFTGEVLYHCNRCFLEKKTAIALAKVHEAVSLQGFSIKLFDCFRPSVVQNALWTAKPNRKYVMAPHKGSNHSRGIAVDVTLIDSTGKELDMGTSFDHFGPESHTDHNNLADIVIKNRSILNKEMIAAGFKGIRTEWWHYSYLGVQKPEVSDWEWPCDE